MQGDENYIDQLFQDHFEDFAKCPSEEVWNGITSKGKMANGRPFAFPGGWRSGVTLLSSVVLCLMLLSGSDASQVPAPLSTGPVDFIAMNRPLPQADFAQDTLALKSDTVRANATKPVKGTFIYTSVIEKERSKLPTSQALVLKEEKKSTINKESSGLKERNSKSILKLGLLLNPKLLSDSIDSELTQRARRRLKHDLFATSYYKKPKGGHWFVSGGAVLDGGYTLADGAYSDGLTFGAGKYINKNAFMEIALRGIWGHGFNMRATYTHLLLPGKIRPFLQAGLAWDYELDFRAGAGLMFEPSQLRKWRLYASVNYEKGSVLFERNSGADPVFELGIQLRLSGTEPLLSDNNWMNSIPHYKVPKGWYLESSSNFAFFDKTKVTRISFYAGKNLNRRLFARAGLRLGREGITLPAQLQYHAVVRQKLRFGVYGGPSIDISEPGLGAELGLIAYYEVIPGCSLYVAPVILDNSEYRDRVFETGIRYYLGSKKK